MRTPSFLATNDDGIHSPFLAALVHALAQVGEVTVVAPSGERSWIGKAITRRGQLRVSRRAGIFPGDAWEVDGTPADCVNLGLGHLVKGRIDAVVSGINIGSNAGLPLILASGTVGAALEGALLGKHAIAASLRLDPGDFLALSRRSGESLPGHLRRALEAAAARSAEICARVARRRSPGRFLVHNLNFPPEFAPEAEIRRTVPAVMGARSLFAPVEETNGEIFSFSFAVGDEQANRRLSDRTCIECGEASHSILDFGRIGVPARAGDGRKVVLRKP